MINPIKSTHAPDVDQTARPQAPKPAPQPQPSRPGTLSSDKVTLKNTGDVDHDGDSK